MTLQDRSREDLIREIEELRCRLRKYEHAEPEPRWSPSSQLEEPPPSSASGSASQSAEHGGGAMPTTGAGSLEQRIQCLETHLGQFKALVDQADQAIMLTEFDPESDSVNPTIVYVNPAFTRMTGYPAEEAIGRNPSILQGPETDSAARKAIRQALNERESIKVEIVNYRKDGTPYWCQLHISPLHNAEGKVTHFYSHSRDITEERALISSLRLFESLVETVNVGVVLMDTDIYQPGGPTILYVNEAFCGISGYNREELRGETPAFVMGRHATPEQHEQISSQLSQGRSIHVPMPCSRKDGTDYWADVRVAPLRDDAGQITHYFVVMKDITEERSNLQALRRSEQRLQEAQQIARMGSWEYNSTTDMLWFSEQLLHMFGLPLDTAMPWREILKKLHVDPLFDMKQLAHLAELDQLPHEAETVIRTMRREEMPLLVRMWAERDHESSGMRIYGTALDITQQKNAETALREAKEAAESASQAKSLFLGVMSHELRTPLNSIIGLSDLLLEHRLPAERQEEYLRLICRSSESLLAIIEDILTYAQSEPGQLRLKSEPFDPRELFKSVVTSLEPNFRSKELEVDYVLDPLMPPLILGDRVRLRQITSNLVSNALKFTDQGGVLCQAHYLPDREQIRVIVSDTGEGIPEEFRQQMFQPFSQADSSSTRRHGGSGLGLAICKRLLDLMGGDITLESTPGEGTVFTVHFPAILPPLARPRITEDDTAPKQIEPETLDTGFAGRHPMRILVVEDDAMNRRLIRVLLVKLGYEFLEAPEGDTAIRLTRENPVDLILMDVQMPGLNGLEVSTMLRKMAADLPVQQPWIVALTANAMPGDREKCLAAGMNDYLSKPIRLAELAARLQDARIAR